MFNFLVSLSAVVEILRGKDTLVLTEAITGPGSRTVHTPVDGVIRLTHIKGTNLSYNWCNKVKARLV